MLLHIFLCLLYPEPALHAFLFLLKVGVFRMSSLLRSQLLVDYSQVPLCKGRIRLHPSSFAIYFWLKLFVCLRAGEREHLRPASP